MSAIREYIIIALVIIAISFSLGPCRSKRPSSTPFTISLDHIRSMRELHLTRYYFEQIIPVEKKDKLKTLIIVPSTIDAFIDLSQLKVEEDSVSITFDLPDIQLSDVTFTLDSAKIYGFKNFGIYFSDNAYSEAVEDIQQGLRIARMEVIKKAEAQGIRRIARQEANEFIISWARMVSDKIIVINAESN